MGENNKISDIHGHKSINAYINTHGLDKCESNSLPLQQALAAKENRSFGGFIVVTESIFHIVDRFFYAQQLV